MWSMDFIGAARQLDALNDERSFCTLNVIEDYNREVLGIEVEFHYLLVELFDVWSGSLTWTANLEISVVIMDQNLLAVL